jgi:hypothetical protein
MVLFGTISRESHHARRVAHNGAISRESGGMIMPPEGDGAVVMRNERNE